MKRILNLRALKSFSSALAELKDARKWKIEPIRVSERASEAKIFLSNIRVSTFFDRERDRVVLFLDADRLAFVQQRLEKRAEPFVTYHLKTAFLIRRRAQLC